VVDDEFFLSAEFIRRLGWRTYGWAKFSVGQEPDPPNYYSPIAIRHSLPFNQSPIASR